MSRTTTTKSVVSVAWWSRISSLMQMWLGHFDWNPSWTSKGTTRHPSQFLASKACRPYQALVLTLRWTTNIAGSGKWARIEDVCISYWTMGIFLPAMFVYRRVSEDDGGWKSLNKGRIFLEGGRQTLDFHDNQTWVQATKFGATNQRSWGRRKLRENISKYWYSIRHMYIYIYTFYVYID